MTQSVGDLVINLDVNDANFEEQLTRARKLFNGLGDSAENAGDKGAQSFSKQELMAKRVGISVGQYSNALRMLPAQFTDIATQLAGGQSPFLIMLQQGGQVKDSFGGVSNLFRAIQAALFGVSTVSDKSEDSLSDNANALGENAENLGKLRGILTPTTLAFGALAVAVLAVGYAYIKGQGIQSEFNKSLVMTGGRAGQTTNNLLFMAEAIAQSGESFTASTTAINALVRAGANLGDNYQNVAASIVTLSDATGTKVEELAGIFGRITSDPEGGLKAMAEQYGHVTAQQLDYVKSLQDSGKYTDALNYANAAAAAGFRDMAGNVKDNMGALETAADYLGDSFKSMWNRLLDIGRADSLQKQLADATDRLYELDKGLRITSAQGQQRFGMENARDQARQMVSSLTDQLHAEQRKTEEKQKQSNLERSSLLNQQHFQSVSDASRTKEEQRTKEYQRLNQYIAERRRLNQALSDEEISQIKKGIEEKYKDPKTPKAKAITTSAGDKSSDSVNAETLALQAQLKVLQQHAGANDTISQQRKSLWETQAKFSVLEDAAKTRTLSKEEQSLLASKDKVLAQAEINAGLGDQIVAQQDLTKLQEALRSKEEKTLDLTKQRFDLLERLKVQGGIQPAEYDKTSADVANKSITAMPRDLQKTTKKGDALNGVSGTFGNDLNQLSKLEQQSTDLQNWYQSNLNALAEYRQQRSDLNVQWDAQELALRQKQSQAEQSIEQQKNSIIQNAVQSSLGSVVDITRTAFGEKSAIYKASFIADKAYAVAQSMLAIQTGIALAVANPFPANLVAMASVAAATASLVSNIQSIGLTGMAHSGIDAVPETGTWLLQKGERVMTSQTSAKLDATLENMQGQRAQSAGGYNYSPTIQVNGDPDQRTLLLIESAVSRGAKQGYDLVTSHIASGRGNVSKALGSGWSTKRRAN